MALYLSGLNKKQFQSVLKAEKSFSMPTTYHLQKNKNFLKIEKTEGFFPPRSGIWWVFPDLHTLMVSLELTETYSQWTGIS